MSIAFSAHRPCGCAAKEVRGQVLPNALWEMALQLGEGLGSGSVGPGILSNSDEIWTVHRQSPRGLLVVLVACLIAQAKDKVA